MGHCHCSMCRRAHGTAFGTYAKVRWEDFAFVAGRDLIEAYPSSPGIVRSFCRRCGSRLQFISEDDRQHFGLAAGTLDHDPGVRPSYHIWTGDKAPWHEIHDDLLSHRSEPGEE